MTYFWFFIFLPTSLPCIDSFQGSGNADIVLGWVGRLAALSAFSIMHAFTVRSWVMSPRCKPQKWNADTLLCRDKNNYHLIPWTSARNRWGWIFFAWAPCYLDILILLSLFSPKWGWKGFIFTHFGSDSNRRKSGSLNFGSGRAHTR